MTFRPLPVLSILTLLLLAVLIQLGIWQFNRAAWKTDEITSYLSRLDAPEMSVEDALCGRSAPADGAPVALDVPFTPQMIRVYGFSIDGVAGWHRYGVIASPDCLADSRQILVELDFEAFESGELLAVERRRIDRFDTRKGMFSSPNVPSKNEWYWLEAEAIDAFLFPSGDDKLNTDWIIVADDGLPPHLKKTPPERHIGYSVTWFGLAIGLLVMYAAFHVHVGRLRFGDKD